MKLQWQLWTGAGGMAAQWGHARVRGQLDRIAKQHGWRLALYPGVGRYTVRTDLTDEQYTVLCLQWRVEHGFEKWKVIEHYGHSKDIHSDLQSSLPSSSVGVT